MLKNRRNQREENLFQKLLPIIDDLGYVLVDLSLRSENKNRILRLYVDKLGGINIDELEEVSKTCDPLLDSWGEDSHDFFEVQSPGLNRPLESVAEYELHIGDDVDVSLYQKYEGKKKFVATILGADNDFLELEDEDGNSFKIEHEKVAQVKQIISFD